MTADRLTRATVQPLSIHIDVVEIEGLTMTPMQARQFRSALQTELQRLAIQHDRRRPWTTATVAAERAPQVRPHAPNRAAQLGTEVGRSLWSAIGGTE